MKTASIIACLIFGGMASAGEPIEKKLVSVNHGGSTYNYVRIDHEMNIEWQLRHQPSGDVVLRFSHHKDKDGTSIFTYSNLIDVAREDDQIGILLSLDVGLLYVRCIKNADGIWSEAWRQKIMEAAGPNSAVNSIKLKNLDTVRTTSKDGEYNEFTLSKAGVKKNGAAYEPGKGFSVKGGSPEKSK